MTQPMAKVDKGPMAEAWKLFEAGNKSASRQIAKQVLASNAAAEDKVQAEELISRLKTPPVAYLFAGAVGLAALVLTLLARSYG